MIGGSSTTEVQATGMNFLPVCGVEPHALVKYSVILSATTLHGGASEMKIVLSPEIVRKAHDGEDGNALNYRIAKCKEANADILIQNPQGFTEPQLKDFLIHVVEIFLRVPVNQHHVALGSAAVRRAS